MIDTFYRALPMVKCLPHLNDPTTENTNNPTWKEGSLWLSFSFSVWQSDPETEAETEPDLQAILEKQWEGQGAWVSGHLNDCFLTAGLNMD